MCNLEMLRWSVRKRTGRDLLANGKVLTRQARAKARLGSQDSSRLPEKCSKLYESSQTLHRVPKHNSRLHLLTLYLCFCDIFSLQVCLPYGVEKIIVVYYD